jgi:hypothetical protein
MRRHCSADQSLTPGQRHIRPPHPLYSPTPTPTHEFHHPPRHAIWLSPLYHGRSRGMDHGLPKF